jgi:hypothetical protein
LPETNAFVGAIGRPAALVRERILGQSSQQKDRALDRGGPVFRNSQARFFGSCKRFGHMGFRVIDKGGKDYDGLEVRVGTGWAQGGQYCPRESNALSL